MNVVVWGRINGDWYTTSLLGDGHEEHNADGEAQHDAADDQLGERAAKGGRVWPRVLLDVFCLGHARRLAWGR